MFEYKDEHYNFRNEVVNIWVASVPLKRRRKSLETTSKIDKTQQSTLRKGKQTRTHQYYTVLHITRTQVMNSDKESIETER